MTIEQDAEVAKVVAGLTKAQEVALRQHDDRVHSLSTMHHRTRNSLFRKGVSADLLAGGHRFFTWTSLGRRVRDHLLSKGSHDAR